MRKKKKEKKKEEDTRDALYNLLEEDTGIMKQIKKSKNKNMDGLIKYFETFSKKPKRTQKKNESEETSESEFTDSDNSSDNMSDGSPKTNKHKSKEYRDAIRKYEKYKKDVYI